MMMKTSIVYDYLQRLKNQGNDYYNFDYILYTVKIVFLAYFHKYIFFFFGDKLLTSN